MSKKNFKGGINTLLGDTSEQNPKNLSSSIADELNNNSIESKLVVETRATFIVNEEILEKLKAIAYWERLKIKEVVNEALLEAVKQYEEKNGVVKPIPTK